MAKLPTYTQQGSISIDVPGNIYNPNTFTGPSRAIGVGGDVLSNLSDQWQKTKDAAENLDGKLKLESGISGVLDEAKNYSDYSNFKELDDKQNELLGKMDTVTPSIVGGFSNNQNAREFKQNATLMVNTDKERLKGLFREKYIDNAKSNIITSQDKNQQAFVLTGDDSYKKSYMQDLDNMSKAGYITEEYKTQMGLKTKNWGYDHVVELANSNPSAALALLNSNEVSQYIDNATDIGKARKIVTQKFNDQKEYATVSGLADLVNQKGDIAQKAVNGQLSFSQLQNFISQNRKNLDINEVKELYKAGGYNVSVEHTTLTPDGNVKLKKDGTGQGQGGTVSKNNSSSMSELATILGHAPTVGKRGGLQKTGEEKFEAYDRLTNLGAEITQNFNKDGAEQSLHNVSKYQHLLGTAYNKGYINQKQFNELIENYSKPLSDYIGQRITVKQGKIPFLGSTNDYGYSQVKGYISKFNDNSDDEDDLTTGFKTQLNANYYQELNKIAKDKGVKNFYQLDSLPDNQEKVLYKQAFDKALATTKATASNPYKWFKAENPAMHNYVSNMLGNDGAKYVSNNTATYQTQNPNATHKDIAQQAHVQANNYYTQNLHNAQNKLLKSMSYQTKALTQGLPDSPQKEQFKQAALSDLQKSYSILANPKIGQQTKNLVIQKYSDKYGVNPAQVLNLSTKKKVSSTTPYANVISSAAQKYGVSPDLISAVIKQESGFNPNAHSPHGAQGLMQLMPATAKSHGVTNPYNPEQNINAGAKHLAGLIAKYDGNMRSAVAAYNAGGGTVDDFLNGTNKTGKNPHHKKTTDGIPPFKETQNYVSSII